MIEKMTRYSFIVYSGDREEFLNTIQEQGVIDIKRSEKAVDEKSVQMFQRIAAAKEDMETIRKGVDAHLIALRAEEKALEDRLEQTIPWGNFEKDKIEALADHGINLHFYCVPAKSFKKEWPEEYPLEVVSDTGSHVYFVTAGECDIPAKEIPMPSANADELQVMLDAKRNEIDRYAASLEARKSELPRLESLVKDTISELNVYLAGVTGEDAAEGSICVFEGYAPEADKERLCAVFDGMDIYYEAHDATLEDNPPIKLRNSRFAGLFESITRMYGMPVYDEFDPTPLLAIFFLLFFAMCMGDAGYGILLVLIGWGISKGKLKIAMFEGLGPIIMVLGVATFVVGLVLGTFFGIDLYQATWVPDAMKSFMVRGKVAGYDAQMVMALGVGVLHICLAMIFKAVYAVRRNGFANSLSTCGWTLLIVGGVLVAAAAALLKFIPSESIKWVVIAIGAISALGIFIFNKPGRNPLLNVGAGLWDTYQMATGLLGDVLSYIRLYALGLAGGLLGAAFNTLALMVRGDSPTWQWLPFVLVLLIGHTLNLLMSCLGAFVHPLRLNFVEFFKNSGYEGKGLRYNPLKK